MICVQCEEQLKQSKLDHVGYCINEECPNFLLLQEDIDYVITGREKKTNYRVVQANMIID